MSKQSSKSQKSNFRVIMDVRPAVIIGRKQTFWMSHGTYIFEDITHPKNNSLLGISISASLSAVNIDKAIEQARGVTIVLLDQLSFLTKTSIPDLRIIKAYDTTPEKKRGKFIQYFYDLPFGLESLRELDKALLKRSSANIINLGEIDNGRVTRAMHWFRLATKSTDALERFTCLWIGLETINLTLCNYFGIETEYSTCEYCNKNVPILSGVKKLFSETGDKKLNWRKMSRLRATTLHGSKPLHEVVSDLKMVIPSLEVALYNGLNQIIGTEGINKCILNIGSQNLARWCSTATIEGPNLEDIDKVTIPGFDWILGTVYATNNEKLLRFGQIPIINETFKFKDVKHTYLSQPDFASKVTFLNKENV